MSRTIHILMAGPIRPSIDYIEKSITMLRTLLQPLHIVTHLATWKTGVDEHRIRGLFDHTYYIEEPTEYDILQKDIQTIQMRYELQGQEKINFINGMYKLFFSYRHLVETCVIPEEDIVMRIRTDLYIDQHSFETLCKTIEACRPNTIYIRPNRACSNLSDWFAISDYRTFKRTYYIPNDTIFKQLADRSGNSEAVIINHALMNHVKIASIDPMKVILRICRSFEEGIEKLHSYD